MKYPIRFGVLTLMIVVAALSRVIPHAPNFTPLGAIALFGAAYFSNRVVAFIIPLASMWLSDLVINNTIYTNESTGAWLFPDGFPWNYFAFLLTVPLGFMFLKRIKLQLVVGSTVLAAILFFIVSNFGCWLGNPHYPQNFGGLISCYIAAIPFFWNTLAGDLLYSALLFGAFELAQRRFSFLKVTNQYVLLNRL